MKIEARVIAHRDGSSVTVQWMEVLSVSTFEEDFGFGPETIEIPEYGRVLAEKSVPKDLFWGKSAPLSEWVPQFLPKPKVTDVEDIPLPD